jgi:hypothetical protein
MNTYGDMDWVDLADWGQRRGFVSMVTNLWILKRVGNF